MVCRGFFVSFVVILTRREGKDRGASAELILAGRRLLTGRHKGAHMVSRSSGADASPRTSSQPVPERSL